MKNKQSFLSRFFSHDITLLVLAFLFAFTAWFIINASSETDNNVTISDIPISIELSDTAIADNLEIFSGDDIKASVEVSGNRVTVGSLTPSDITVFSNQSGTITSPGTYTLPLSAKKTGLKTNYNLESTVNPSTVTVFVDRAKEREFNIDNKLTVKLNDNSHYANTTLSQNKVTVTGPETQVSRIASVGIADTITGSTTKDTTIQEKLLFFDGDGDQLDLPLVVTDIETVEVTISVLPIMTVSLAVDVTNAPSDYPEITVSPSTVKIAGAQDTLDKIENDTISIGTLDFAALKNEESSLKFNITPPTGCKVISGESSAVASIDLSSYGSAVVTAKISSKIDSSVYSAEFTTNNTEIQLYGPEDLISGISASDVTVIADFTGLLDSLNKGNSASLSVPLKITLSSEYDACWAFGSYTTNVNVTKIA